jgi:hypothetical protein
MHTSVPQHLRHLVRLEEEVGNGRRAGDAAIGMFHTPPSQTFRMTSV